MRFVTKSKTSSGRVRRRLELRLHHSASVQALPAPVMISACGGCCLLVHVRLISVCLVGPNDGRSQSDRCFRKLPKYGCSLDHHFQLPTPRSSFIRYLSCISAAQRPPLDSCFSPSRPPVSQSRFSVFNSRIQRLQSFFPAWRKGGHFFYAHLGFKCLFSCIFRWKHQHLCSQCCGHQNSTRLLPSLYRMSDTFIKISDTDLGFICWHYIRPTSHPGGCFNKKENVFFLSFFASASPSLQSLVSASISVEPETMATFGSPGTFLSDRSPSFLTLVTFFCKPALVHETSSSDRTSRHSTECRRKSF
jgi:hypothetical protein